MEMPDADQIKIVRCHRLGPRLSEHKNHALIFKLHWYGDRDKIWAARSKLKGTAYILREDYPAEIQDQRRILYPIFLEARKLNMQPKLSVDKLYIGNKTYTVDSLENLPSDLHPETTSTPVLNDTLQAFYHGQSPLSNFHMSTFTIENESFHSVEQFFQYSKAVLAKDKTSMYSIKNATTPKKCKEIGDRVKGLDRTLWENRCITIMSQGCLAKFQQNAKLKEFLPGTGTRTPVEASPSDLFWGAGFRLGDPKLKNPNLWKGKNQLGQVLMDIRQMLQ